jgi:hypothetical protein
MAILLFVKPHEEYLVACVCKDLYDVLKTRREMVRGKAQWETHAREICRTAALFRWAIVSDPEIINKNLWHAAAMYAPIEILSWGRSEARGVNVKCLDAAVSRERAEERGEDAPSLDTEQLLLPQEVRLAVATTFTISERSSFLAASMGRVDVLDWIIRHNYRWELDIAFTAVEYGHVSVLEWVWKHDGRDAFHSTCMILMFELAAEFGHLGVLKWLYDRSAEHVPVYIRTARGMAISAGHAEIVAWTFTMNPHAHIG